MFVLCYDFIFTHTEQRYAIKNASIRARIFRTQCYGGTAAAAASDRMEFLFACVASSESAATTAIHLHIQPIFKYTPRIYINFSFHSCVPTNIQINARACVQLSKDLNFESGCIAQHTQRFKSVGTRASSYF